MPADPDELRALLELTRPVLRILAIWLLAIGVLAFVRRVLALKQRLIAHFGRGDVHDLLRLATLFNVLRYAADVVVLGMAALMTLGELGISIAPILATAGVAGIAVGFGAQSLVKDFFTGLCLLIENQIREGDTIEVAGKSGMVERITLRHVRLRDYDGSVHFIPNGIITALTNRSRDFAFAVIDVSVPREVDPERVFRHMRQVGQDMRNDPALHHAVMDEVEVAGVERMEDAALVLRCRLKVAPARQWRVRREFLQRIKPLLDAERGGRESASGEEGVDVDAAADEATTGRDRPGGARVPV